MTPLQIAFWIAITTFTFPGTSISSDLRTPSMPNHLFGKYSYQHQVHDNHIACQENRKSNCGILNVEDRIIISTKDLHQARVEIILLGKNLHTCEFEGNGYWNGQTFTATEASDYYQEKPCTVEMTFIRNNIVKVSSYPNEACEKLCGAGMFLYSEKTFKK